MLKRICHTRQLPLALLISAVATLGSDGALAQSAGLTLSQVGAPNTTTSCASGQPFCAITITDTFSYSNASPITFSAGNALSATLSFSNPLTIYGTSILNPTVLYIDFPATYSPISNLNYSETLSFSDNGNLVSVPFLTYFGGSGGSFLVFGAENYSGPNITIDSLLSNSLEARSRP